MPANSSQDYASEPGDVVPSPDPTRLTIQLVDRSLTAYREVFATRLSAMDTATKLVAEDLLRTEKGLTAQMEHIAGDRQRELASSREYVLSQVAIVNDVSREKFLAIATQFDERDTRTEQAAQESRISLGAALAAAKEAVSEQNNANSLAIGKSEDATKERLDALAVLMTTSNRSLEDKISDLKGRFDRGEGRGTGAQEARIDGRTVLFAVVGLSIAGAGLAIAFIK